MEALTRMVADSLARHGFDSPVDPRRLQWSRWFRCDSPRSLLVVPSKPGIFAIAEEVMDIGPGKDLGSGKVHVGTAALGCPAERSSAPLATGSDVLAIPRAGVLGGAALQRCDPAPLEDAASAPEAPTHRMLAVLQFSEDDDIAFVLDRMFASANPMRARFASGRCFLRFVVIEDQAQRRSLCNALNQWMLTSAEKASGIDFKGRTLPSAGSESALSSTNGQAPSPNAGTLPRMAQAVPPSATKNCTPAVAEVPAPHLDSGANKSLHCPHTLPSGF